MRFAVLLALVLCFAHSNVGQRIGNLFEPYHYDLVMLPLMTGVVPRLCGHVYIDVEPKATTNIFLLHGYDITVLDVNVAQVSFLKNVTTPPKFSQSERLQSVEDVCFSGIFDRTSGDVDTVNVEEDRQLISIVFKKPFIAKKKYRVGIFYIAKINTESKGFFRANYKNDSTSCCNEGWFGGTQMETTHARRVLPCFDEPAFKATFDITIGHERSMSALANMPETTVQSMANTRDWKWTSYATSPPMPTYLLAMIVTDYQYVERIYKSCGRSVRMRFWGRPEQLPNLKQAIEIAPKMLHSMEEFLRQPFTLPKIDFIAAPIELIFVAMENWGLILFNEERLFHIEGIDDEEDRFQDAQTMAHELAHQFFGNLVTSDWWSDFWFNEGFCGIYEIDLVKEVLPELDFYADRARVSSIQSAMKVEEYVKADPVARSAETADETEKLFDSITYSKANSLLLMLRNVAGDQNFRNALITYMDRYQFESVNSRRFMEILNKEIHRDHAVGRGMNIVTIMDSWTERSYYPIVRCSRSSHGRIKLSQMPYSKTNGDIGQHVGNDGAKQLWWIPISITDSTRPDFSRERMLPRVWLTPNRPSLEISYLPLAHNRAEAANSVDDITWIIVNGQVASYGRVLYDEANWRQIAKQLLLNHTVIPSITRAQLIDDAFTLALSEYLGYDIVLDVIEYMTTVKDEFVLPATLFHLKWMKEKARQNETFHQLFQDYTKRMLVDEKDLNKYTMGRTSGAITNELDVNSLCEHWSEDECADQALHLFNAQMDGSLTREESKAMNEKLERHWCTVLRLGGQREWKWAWQASLSDEWAPQRTKILSALSCSQDRGQLKKLLSRVLHPATEQDPRDSFTLIDKMADNPVARPIVLNFIKNNWEFLGKNLRKPNDNVKLLSSVTKHMNTKKDLDEIAKFIADREVKDKTLDLDFKEAILGNIRLNIRWTEKRSDGVYALLKARQIDSLHRVR